MMREGFLVTRRHKPAELRTGPRIVSRDDLGPRAICRRYGGFDGVPWPLDQVLNEDSERDVGDYSFIEARKHMETFVRKCPSEKCDLLYIRVGSYGPPQSWHHHGFEFIGYDFGCYIARYNFYSVIFNEVLFGFYPALKAFETNLNDQLLFDSTESLVELSALRRRMLESGAKLETSAEEDEDPIAIAIYRYAQGASN